MLVKTTDAKKEFKPSVSPGRSPVMQTEVAAAKHCFGDALEGAWSNAKDFTFVNAQPYALFSGSGKQRNDVPLDSGFILLFMCMSKKNLWGADC